MLSNPLILRALIALVIAGIVFPQTGLFLLRMNLLPLRFMLLHGVLLGGAIALSISEKFGVKLDPSFVAIITNILAVIFMINGSNKFRKNPGEISAVIMVFTLSIASIIIYKFKVPAKDTLDILWGSPFTITPSMLYLFSAFSTLVLLLTYLKRNELRALFYDKEIAIASGINEKQITLLFTIITATSVAFGIKIVGALLVDSILLVPAIISTIVAKSVKGSFLLASLIGLITALLGFFISIRFDFPVSGSIAIVSALIFVILYLIKGKKK